MSELLPPRGAAGDAPIPIAPFRAWSTRRRERIPYRLIPRALTIGIDIGGTRVKAGVVDYRGRVVDRTSRPTPTREPATTENTIVSIVQEFAQTYDVRAVGIGAAGFIDENRSTVLFSPHLAWRHEQLRDRVQARIGLRTVVENDANTAAWGESQFGAAAGESHVVMITLGTGIGGGIITNGRLERGRFGIAGEFGHMTVQPRGKRCECGNRGCWEQYAGGSALIREARELASSGSPMASRLREAVGGNLDSVDGRIVTKLAREGDTACLELLSDLGEWLGFGLASLAASIDPGMFVVGGGISGAGDMILDPARQVFARSVTGRGYRPLASITRAQLGNDAGFIGAADLARYDTTRSNSAGATSAAARRRAARYSANHLRRY